jgi:hypothetical protein
MTNLPHYSPVVLYSTDRIHETTECIPWKKSFICLQEGTSDGCLCLTQILGFQQCTSLQCRHTFLVELIPVNMWTMPYTHRDHHFWRLQYFHRMIQVILGPTLRIELTRTLRARGKLQRTWSHSDHVTPSPVQAPFPNETPGAQLVQWWCTCLPPSLLAPVPRPRELLPHALAVVAVPPASINSTPHRDSIPSPAMAEGEWTTNGWRTTARSCSTELKVSYGTQMRWCSAMKASAWTFCLW